MAGMSPKEYEQLIELLDGRIDELTKPIPSRQILRFAEAIGSAKLGDEDCTGTYSEEDYSNLLSAQLIVDKQLPPLLENIRAQSIDQRDGWRFVAVDAGDGDYGLCGVCRKPYQHFHSTVKVHCIDMHPNAFRGVCRDCVRQYAPLSFIESNGVEEWLNRNHRVCEKMERDDKAEGQRIKLIDAIRQHAHTTHYFGDIVRKASRWAQGAFGEWR